MKEHSTKKRKAGVCVYMCVFPTPTVEPTSTLSTLSHTHTIAYTHTPEVIFMGGFEHLIVDEPKEIQNIVNALEAFREYLKATNQEAWEELGLLHYSLFKNENEVVCTIYPAGTKLDNIEAKPCAIKTVKDEFADKLEEIRAGKWLLYWFEIDWLWKIPLPLINRLKQACAENNCLNFWNKLAGTSENISELCLNALSHALPNALNIEENRAW